MYRAAGWPLGLDPFPFKELAPCVGLNIQITLLTFCWKCSRRENEEIKRFSHKPIHVPTSFLCQIQEEEKSVWDCHLCGGDSGGGDATHNEVQQLLQSEMGWDAHSVRSNRLPPVSDSLCPCASRHEIYTSSCSQCGGDNNSLIHFIIWRR